MLYLFSFPSHQHFINTSFNSHNQPSFQVPTSPSLPYSLFLTHTDTLTLTLTPGGAEKKMNRRVSFSPESILHPRHGGGGAKVGENKKRFLKILTSKLPNGSRFSPGRFLRHIGTKVEVALRLVSSRRRCSCKVSSASFARSRSYAETLDSQRAEAIEDCIDFLNSSCSLQRSNSVTSSC